LPAAALATQPADCRQRRRTTEGHRLIDAGEYGRAGGYADGRRRRDVDGDNDRQIGSGGRIEQIPLSMRRVFAASFCAPTKRERRAVVSDAGDGGGGAVCDVHRNANEQRPIRRGRGGVIKSECLRAWPCQICRDIRAGASIDRDLGAGGWAQREDRESEPSAPSRVPVLLSAPWDERCSPDLRRSAPARCCPRAAARSNLPPIPFSFVRTMVFPNLTSFATTTPRIWWPRTGGSSCCPQSPRVINKSLS
jgi:hypothetical protein